MGQDKEEKSHPPTVLIFSPEILTWVWQCDQKVFEKSTKMLSQITHHYEFLFYKYDFAKILKSFFLFW
jgi:hypothetical protein